MSSEPFEYAVIRVVPRVERGETMNAGVILYSQQHGYLGCLIQLDTERLRALDPGADAAAAAAGLTAIEEGCGGGGGPASRRVRGSAGSPRRGARSSSRGRCTVA